jgi:hypothetical protein
LIFFVILFIVYLIFYFWFDIFYKLVTFDSFFRLLICLLIFISFIDGATASEFVSYGSSTYEGTVSESESSVGAGLFVPVRTFADIVHRLMVTKREGMERVSLLAEEGDDDDHDNEGRITLTLILAFLRLV